MIAKINQLLQEVEALKAANAEELEALRIKYLSKKGAINDLMADFRNVAAEQKKEVGMRLNELKNKAQEKIAALKEQFESPFSVPYLLALDANGHLITSVNATCSFNLCCFSNNLGSSKRTCGHI